MKYMLCVGDSNEYTQHTMFVQKIVKTSRNHHPFRSDLAPWLTLSGSNNQYLEQIPLVPKVFK